MVRAASGSAWVSKVWADQTSAAAVMTAVNTGNRPPLPRDAQYAPTTRPGKASQATSKTSWPNVAGRFRLGEKPTAMVRNHTATAPTAQTMTFSAELLGP